MGYQQVIVTAWVNEGERPDNSLPSIPGRPDQGLPGGGGGGRPDQGLPPFPSQGLPGAPVYPDQGLPGGGGRPDQGLPPYAQPKAYDVPPEPSGPPSSGTWVIAVMGNTATWVFLPDNEHMPPPTGSGGQPDNTLPTTPGTPDQGLPPTTPDNTLPPESGGMPDQSLPA